MVDITFLIALALAVGAFGGFISSLFKWMEVDEPFETKKNIKGIITGLITGLVIGVAAISAMSDTMTPQTLTVAIATIFFSAVGVDKLTSNVSGMVSKPSKKSGQPV
jgi:H+/Cl- antiporter ClcA